jgi:hypothetical protein
MPKQYDDVGLRKWCVKKAIEASYATKDLDVVVEATRIYDYLTELIVFEAPPVQEDEEAKAGYTYYNLKPGAYSGVEQYRVSDSGLVEFEIADGLGDWRESHSYPSLQDLLDTQKYEVES